MLKQWSLDRKFNEFIYFHLRKLLSVPIAAAQVENASFIMGEILILLFLYVSSELFLWLRWNKCDTPVLEENSDSIPGNLHKFLLSVCAWTKALYFRFEVFFFQWIKGLQNLILIRVNAIYYSKFKKALTSFPFLHCVFGKFDAFLLEVNSSLHV